MTKRAKINRAGGRGSRSNRGINSGSGGNSGGNSDKKKGYRSCFEKMNPLFSRLTKHKAGSKLVEYPLNFSRIELAPQDAADSRKKWHKIQG